ncbi:MAG: Ni/Fe hydrogenase subunit alpha [Candidatus Dormiibacterota bacterium]
MTRDTRDLTVSGLARVEGEGAMHVVIEGRTVTDVRLRIYEPPRFFEGFLRGRNFTEAPDITARICGICPVAYQMSACEAIEMACGVTVDSPIQSLRRLLYCGEWIESHALHIYFLHAPDFLGADSALELARDNREVVERGLMLKKVGNQILEAIGGRAIHPINVRIGGFHRVPTPTELAPLAERLRWARDAALETVRWVSRFPFPDLEVEHELVALAQPDSYAIIGGRVVSDQGLDISVPEFPVHFVEEQVAHSTALHARTRAGGRYLVGPLARYTLSQDRLPPVAREAAAEAGLGAACRNPFRSIVVRAVETLAACDEAIRIIEDYVEPERPAVPVEPRAGIGHGATEAPRGLLYHRYELDAEGTILSAVIIPPTSQNQDAIEHDLRRLVEANLSLRDSALQHLCEQSIRNYDPCISCSTHFLDIHVDRR